MTIAVFVSYRRGDASGSAGRLYDALSARFGDSSVFMDVDNIQPGDDFVEVLNRTLLVCRAIVVVIDPGWLSARDPQGRRRLDNPRDFVRLEVESALRNGLLILPALVDGAIMPSPDELPPSMSALAYRQGVEISPTRFRYDTGRLLAAVERFVGSPVNAGNDTKRTASVDAPILDVDTLGPDTVARDFKQVGDLLSRPIRATAEVVWATLIDISRYPEDVPMVVAIEPMSPGPVRVGYKYKQLAKVMMIPIAHEFEITEFDPPRRLSMACSSSSQVESLHQYTVVSDGQTTMIRCVMSGSASIWFLDKVLGKMMERRWFEKLAKVAEAEQARRLQ